MLWIVGGLAGAFGLVVGLVVGWVIGARRARMPEPPQVEPTVESTIPADVAELLALLKSATVVVGPHDEILQSSVAARTLGLVRGSRVGVPEVLEEVRQVRRSGEVVTRDLEIKRGVGAPVVHLTVRIAPLAQDLVVLLAEDRTQAKRIDETRKDFVANVSHELKTPIGAISLLTEAIAEAADDPEAVQHFAGRLTKETARLGELVGQIIDLSRLQSDDPMLRATKVEVDGVIDEAMSRCRELAAGHGVALHAAPHTGLTVLGDRPQLVDAVANLVHNAIVYSDEGARVAVSTRAVSEDGEESVDISVSDNGIGISAENLQRIFERFYRVDYARSRANGGTGLGLSIVKHIATVHGGQISVWSQPGQGSTFTMRLPALTDSDTKE